MRSFLVHCPFIIIPPALSIIVHTVYMNVRCVGSRFFFIASEEKHKKSRLRKTTNRNQYKYDSVAHPVCSPPASIREVSASCLMLLYVTGSRALNPVGSFTATHDFVRSQINTLLI